MSTRSLIKKALFCFALCIAALININCNQTDDEVDAEEIFADVIFFVNKPSNCGIITVNVDGFASKSISAEDFSTTAPFCGGPGATFRNVREGTYSYSAVCDNNEVSGTFTITQGGCQEIFLDILKDDPDGDANENDGIFLTQEDVVFWTSEDFGCGNIDVTIGVGSIGNDPIGGSTKTINSFFNQAPDCWTDGSATFRISRFQGYSFKATCAGLEWIGTIQRVSGRNCTEIELRRADATPVGPGSVKFWTSEDFGCGNITVEITGQGSSVITGFFNSAPSCDNTNGGGNFDNLPPGNYSYTASCPGGISWSGDITINANGCVIVQLTV